MNSEKEKYLQDLEQKEDFVSVIQEVRELLDDDIENFKMPFIKHWCRRRWINIFTNDAINDPVALKASRKKGFSLKKDQRSNQQKIAERFLKGEKTNDWATQMPAVDGFHVSNTSLLFSPGLLTGMLPVHAFQKAFPAIEEKFGLRILRSDSHPVRNCEANCQDLMNAIDKGVGFSAGVEPISEADGEPLGDLFIIAYSKGMPDVLTLLVKHPELKSRIRCIFNWGGAVGGSYLADDMYESVKDMEIPIAETFIQDLMIRLFPAINRKGLLRRFGEFDLKAATLDLTTGIREEFLKDNLEAINALNIPVFNLTGSTTVLDVPYFQIQGTMELNKYDANNDMQLTQKGAKLKMPMAADLAMLNAHHWDMSYDPFPKLARFGSTQLNHPFPKEAAVSAMLKLSVELGLVD
jgi:hypothetical protein